MPMDFSLTDEEQMVLDAAAEFARRGLLGKERDHEREGCVSDASRKSFAESGLDLLSTTLPGTNSDGMDLSWPARIQALTILARTDAAAAMALWLPGTTAALAKSLGAPADAVAGLGQSRLVDAVGETSAPCSALPMAGASRILDLDREGRWGIAEVTPSPSEAMALHAAGPRSADSVAWLAQGQVEAEAAHELRHLLRLVGSALLVGLARASTDYTAAYVQERVAFSKPLSHHQGVAFIVAEMAIRTTGCELLLDRAGWDLEQGQSRTGTDAWLEACETALWVTDQAVQLLGGHGYMKDHPVEKWMREARTITLLWGGVDAARADAARDLDLGAES
ncbi:MAG TPA: hypothetical protein DIU15_07130 [Deltaproteobacteria bacterium]|nr:hypothetical protein [Deltaproteobacteria bacterium]HCP45796.1 hypothetical protein [Deltaproteobacteria bacterium]